MKKIILSFFLLAPFFGKGQAIKFNTFGSGFNNASYNPVRCLFYDTIAKKLYAGGQFALADGKTVWGSAVWSNNMWDSLKGGLTQFPQLIPNQSSAGPYVWKIIRFQNKIYYVGGISWVNGKNQYYMGVWNGSNWDYPIAEPPNGDVKDLVVHNNILYACGTFTKFGSTICNYVAKFDGLSWQPVGDFSKFHLQNHPPAQMNSITVYNGEIYVGGAFDDSTGTPKNIAKYNGSNWVNVGSGIQQSGIAWVQDLEEINNRLYIAGYFARTSEIPGESFVAWNGSEFEDIHSDISSGTFRSFYRSRDKLFVLASFYDVNHNIFPAIKFITPKKECFINSLTSTFTNSLNYSLDCMESINDTLIIGGLFQYLDTVSANSIGAISSYEDNSSCLIAGVEVFFLNSNLIRIYPNPVKELLKIEFEMSEIDAKKLRLMLSNSLGQVVYSKNNLEQKQEIDLSFLPNGIYFLKLQNNSEQKVIKLIKD